MTRQRFEYEIFGVGPRSRPEPPAGSNALSYLPLLGPRWPDIEQLRKESDEMAEAGWRLVTSWAQDKDFIFMVWEREYTPASDSERESRRKRLGFLPPEKT